MTINETGLTVYLLIRNSDSLIWNTSSLELETYHPANYDLYDIPAAEQDVTGYYYAGSPGALPVGDYRFDWREQAGGVPAVTDICLACSSAYWNGTAWLSGASSDPLLNPVPGSYPPGSAGEALGLIPSISTQLSLTVLQLSPSTVDTTMGSPFELTVGTLVRCTAIFTDPLNGDEPLDPDAVYFSYRSPDGISTTLEYGVDPDVFRDSQGRYHYDLLLTQPRIWYYSFWSPGPDGRAITEATIEVKSGLIEHSSP